VDESGKKIKARALSSPPARAATANMHDATLRARVNGGDTLASLVLRSRFALPVAFAGWWWVRVWGGAGLGWVRFGSYAPYDDPWTNGRGEEGKRRAGPWTRPHTLAGLDLSPTSFGLVADPIPSSRAPFRLVTLARFPDSLERVVVQQRASNYRASRPSARCGWGRSTGPRAVQRLFTGTRSRWPDLACTGKAESRSFFERVWRKISSARLRMWHTTRESSALLCTRSQRPARVKRHLWSPVLSATAVRLLPRSQRPVRVRRHLWSRSFLRRPYGYCHCSPPKL
jgi:hypothetical protein